MARTNAQSKALQPKTDRTAERLAAQKQKMEKRAFQVETQAPEPAEHEQVNATSVGAQDTAEPGPRRGRPPGTETRMPFTCRPLTKTVKQLKIYAAEHGCTLSQIIDALTETHLQDADVAETLMKK